MLSLPKHLAEGVFLIWATRPEAFGQWRQQGGARWAGAVGVEGRSRHAALRLKTGVQVTTSAALRPSSRTKVQLTRPTPCICGNLATCFQGPAGTAMPHAFATHLAGSAGPGVRIA